MKLRIGLIGFGSWTVNAYLPVLLNDDRVSITAVVAASDSTRRKVKDVLGNSVLTYSDYKEMILADICDAVMIAVPDEIHRSAISAVIQKGLPVFFEPPLADIRTEIVNMISEVKNAKKPVVSNLELALNPVISYASEIVKKKAIGLIQSITITLLASWGKEKPNLDLSLIGRSTPWYVDILNTLLNSIPTRVLVLDGYGNTGRRQTISTGIFDYDGIWGILKINVNSAEELKILIEVNGNDGDIEIDLLSGQLKLRTLNSKEWEKKAVPAKQPYASWPGVYESITKYIDILDNKNTDTKINQKIIQLHLIALAAEESVDTKSWVKINNKI